MQLSDRIARNEIRMIRLYQPKTAWLVSSAGITGAGSDAFLTDALDSVRRNPSDRDAGATDSDQRQPRAARGAFQSRRARAGGAMHQYVSPRRHHRQRDGL